ncbi:MAG: UvrB/UvrC motif-containing protein [Candidatus Nealsonbacteria bacterium]|nr:UvrB/UvrC motif-containing protein [Candidatus Nealsonbacteria bacterium]
MNKFKFLKKGGITKLPKNAGVYVFKKGREILYIGKAVNIKERIKQHKELLGLAKQLGYIETDSEIEALILEANLIKKYQPKYNIVWRDDKNYFYVGITKEDFPRVFITHQIKPTSNSKFQISNFLGPFVEGTALKRTLTYLRKVFPYYTAKKHPMGSCLWCSLKLCPGPNPVKSEYQKNIKNLISVLEGSSKNVLNNLKREINRFSALQEYEKAAKIRDKITALEKVISHARVFESEIETPKNWEKTHKILQKIFKTEKEISRIEAYDVSNIQGKEATGSMVTFIKGLPDKNFYRRFRIKNRASKGSEGEEEGETLFALQGKPNDVAMIKEILNRRFKHPEWGWPDLILIDGGKAQLNAALSILNQHKSAKSALISVLALAKKENKLFIEGRKKPVLLKSLSRELFNLILQLRDEAHRFAITYHRKLRTNSLLKK